MKPFILIIFFFCKALYAFSQLVDNAFGQDEKNIYYSAIKEYLHIAKDRFANVDSIYIDADYNSADSLLNECGKFKLIKVKGENLLEWIQQNRSINLFRIFPVKFESGTFSVAIAPIGVGYNRKKRKIEFLYGGNDVMFFRYDGNQFHFLRIQERWL